MFRTCTGRDTVESMLVAAADTMTADDVAQRRGVLHIAGSWLQVMPVGNAR